MGLYVEGQPENVIPIFIPRSTGDIATLPVKEIAALIPNYTPETLGFTMTTISELFPPGHQIVVAYNKGHRGLIVTRTSYASSITQTTGPGELCYYATKMTRDVRHVTGEAWGMEIYGAAIIFYLEPGKHFWPDPDFGGMLQVNGNWDQVEGATDRRTLKRLAKDFVEELERYHILDRWVDAFLFPAFETKPRVVKLEFDVKDIKDDIVAACGYRSKGQHVPEGKSIKPKTWGYLGLGYIEPRLIERIPSRGLLQRPLKAYWFDDRIPRNKSIVHLTEGKANHIWGRNVLVLATDGDDYADVTMDELDAVIEYFSHYIDIGRQKCEELLSLHFRLLITRCQ